MKIQLNEVEWEAFLKLLNDPPLPNEKLKKLMKEHENNALSVCPCEESEEESSGPKV